MLTQVLTQLSKKLQTNQDVQEELSSEDSAKRSRLSTRVKASKGTSIAAINAKKILEKHKENLTKEEFKELSALDADEYGDFISRRIRQIKIARKQLREDAEDSSLLIKALLKEGQTKQASDILEMQTSLETEIKNIYTKETGLLETKTIAKNVSSYNKEVPSFTRLYPLKPEQQQATLSERIKERERDETHKEIRKISETNVQIKEVLEGILNESKKNKERIKKLETPTKKKEPKKDGFEFKLPKINPNSLIGKLKSTATSLFKTGLLSFIGVQGFKLFTWIMEVFENQTVKDLIDAVRNKEYGEIFKILGAVNWLDAIQGSVPGITSFQGLAQGVGMMLQPWKTIKSLLKISAFLLRLPYILTSKTIKSILNLPKTIAKTGKALKKGGTVVQRTVSFAAKTTGKATSKVAQHAGKVGKAGTKAVVKTTRPVAAGQQRLVSNTRTAKVIAKTAKGQTSVAKAIPPGAMRVLKAAGKFARFIPILGQIGSGALLQYSAVHGWRNADEVLGIPKNKVNTKQKFQASLGAIAEDVSFGVVKARTVAKTAMWAGRLIGVDMDGGDNDNDDAEMQQYMDAQNAEKDVSQRNLENERRVEALNKKNIQDYEYDEAKDVDPTGIEKITTHREQHTQALIDASFDEQKQQNSAMQQNVMAVVQNVAKPEKIQPPDIEMFNTGFSGNNNDF